MKYQFIVAEKKADASNFNEIVSKYDFAFAVTRQNKAGEITKYFVLPLDAPDLQKAFYALLWLQVAEAKVIANFGKNYNTTVRFEDNKELDLANQNLKILRSMLSGVEDFAIYTKGVNKPKRYYLDRPINKTSLVFAERVLIELVTKKAEKNSLKNALKALSKRICAEMNYISSLQAQLNKAAKEDEEVSDKAAKKTTAKKTTAKKTTAKKTAKAI